MRAATLILSLNCFGALADTPYTVVGISDGDTVTLLSPDKKQLHVRLMTIDAPEKAQPYGNAAKMGLSRLIFKKQVGIDAYKVDRYGRTVATLWLGEQDICLEMVKSGMAWVYTKYADPRIFPEYYSAEAQARTKHLGLWSQPNPVPPWAFRHPDQYSAAQPVVSPKAKATCGNKRFCKQMKDCAEAKHYLTVCQVHQLDKNGDGVPCESLCR